MGEAVGCVAGLDDAAMVRDAIEQRGCHLGVPEDRDPFAKFEVGGDDDTGRLIEFADQMGVVAE